MKSNDSVNVIIADDNEQNLYFLEVMLKNEKYNITSVSNGQEALQYLKKNKYDLIISDILMPVLDGFQLCWECKSDPVLRGIPFIFYTATYISEQDKDFALSLGADRFIIKPAEPGQFMNIIREVLQQYTEGMSAEKKYPGNDEKKYLMEYCKRLSGKLESKIEQLEAANKALAESEGRYRLVVNNSLEAIAIIQDGEFRFVNSTMEELTGYSAAELYKMKAMSYVDEDYRQELNDLYEKIMESRIYPGIHVYKAYNKEQKRLWLESIEKKIIWEGNPGIISFIRNITEKKQLENEIKEINTNLKFSYSISHDLRSPIVSIDGISQILLEDYSNKFDKEVTELLNRIHMSTHYMNKLIENMLLLSKIGRYELRYHKIDLTKIVNSIVYELKKNNPERQVTIIIGQVPEIESDLYLLNIALTNLINNAWKFTEKNPDARIEFGSMNKNDEEIYFIKDNGAGFDMACADKLFTTFYRLHTQKEFSGTGIGLVIAERIFSRLGGRIWFDAEVNKGATFYFLLHKGRL